MNWSIVQSDAIEWLNQLPNDSVDLLFTSPPYELARTYGIGDKMVGGQAWVDWMVAVVRAAAPKVKGLIAINCEGQTRNYAYSGVPFLLFTDLHRAGFNLRKPAVFHRVGIPGSGGPDWLRNDYEPIICVTRKGKLPWSENTACGHPPKWAPGGEMAHRLASGARVNEWGPVGSAKGGGDRFAPDGEAKPAKANRRTAHGVIDTSTRRRTGTDVREKMGRSISRGHADGDTKVSESYDPPKLANPGNVIKCIVGGNVMGHPLAHENEAPFPLTLAEFFVRSFCPPGGLVIDPFAGSGTTGHAAKKWGRAFAGCDVRQSQVELSERRLATVTTELFV